MSRTAVLAVLTIVLAGCSANETAPDRGPAPADAATVDEAPDGLEPMPYELRPVGPTHHPVAVVEVPDGYSVFGPFVEAAEPPEPEDPLSISLWVVTGVYRNACKQTRQIPAGDSVRTLANAFVEQEVLTATRPRPVTLAGHHGLYLEIAAPTKPSYSRCKEAELTFWEAEPAGSRWTRMPGMRDRLWILDVDGQPMVLAMFVPPSATEEQIDKITDILDGARFVTG